MKALVFKGYGGPDQVTFADVPRPVPKLIDKVFPFGQAKERFAYLEKGRAKWMRGDGQFVFAQAKNAVGVDCIVSHIIHAWQHARGVTHGH